MIRYRKSGEKMVLEGKEIGSYVRNGGERKWCERI